MNKAMYLLSLGLLILLSLVTAFQGARYIASPVGLFQLASLANLFLPFIISGLLVVFLSVRFTDVLLGRADISVRPSRPIARVSQTAGRSLLWIFYVLLAVAIVFLIQTRGHLGGEISFLFGPLFKALPAGVILIELGRLMDNHESAA